MRRRPLRRTKWGIELPRRAKKRKIFSSETFSERIILLMSSHDTPGVDSHQASAASTHMIEEISDLLLQASGLCQEPCADQLSQSQQDEATPRGRGRPQQVGGTQLWSSLLLCAQEAHAFICGLASPARFAGNRPICSSLAHAQWPGQTAPPGWPGPLPRSVGGCQCAAGPSRFPGGTRNARRFCS